MAKRLRLPKLASYSYLNYLLDTTDATVSKQVIEGIQGIKVSVGGSTEIVILEESEVGIQHLIDASKRVEDTLNFVILATNSVEELNLPNCEVLKYSEDGSTYRNSKYIKRITETDTVSAYADNFSQLTLTQQKIFRYLSGQIYATVLDIAESIGVRTVQVERLVLPLVDKEIVYELKELDVNGNPTIVYTVNKEACVDAKRKTFSLIGSEIAELVATHTDDIAGYSEMAKTSIAFVLSDAFKLVKSEESTNHVLDALKPYVPQEVLDNLRDSKLLDNVFSLPKEGIETVKVKCKQSKKTKTPKAPKKTSNKVSNKVNDKVALAEQLQLPEPVEEYEVTQTVKKAPKVESKVVKEVNEVNSKEEVVVKEVVVKEEKSISEQIRSIISETPSESVELAKRLNLTNSEILKQLMKSLKKGEVKRERKLKEINGEELQVFVYSTSN